ncbi:GNAT family N-acetyltransferase [Bradyrhizobium sp. S69]|uniref:GNAT family N-acetyltransferase n=1 Tax=Bradyrhizobium sp. S69 TaxID=1641856 RepID=UPI0032DE3B56
MYSIRELDGLDDEVGDVLTELHRLTFFDGAPIPKFDQGYWWLAFREAAPVGFAGVIPSTRAHNAGYFSRVGVLRKHCGHGLQLRMMRATECRPRNNGGHSLVSDATDNIASANNFIRAATVCISREIHGHGRTHCIGESPSNDGVIVVDGNV